MSIAQNQPPSGGCVLKHGIHGVTCQNADPAAFGRLCVETNQNNQQRQH